jgi:hypothetical protein
MGDPRYNKGGVLTKLVLSIALSAIAIGLAPLTFLAAKYQVFGALSFHILCVIIPFTATAIAILSFFFAIVGRRYSRFGWLFIILSCCAIVFPLLFIYWVLNYGRY